MRTRTLPYVALLVGLSACLAGRTSAETPLSSLLAEGPWTTGTSATAPLPAVEDLVLCGHGCTGSFERAGCCGTTSGDCGSRWYVSGIIGASFATLSSGGRNTAEGGFDNAGATNDQLFTGGGALGMAFARPGGQLRAEIEGRGRNVLVGSTEGFQPPAATTFYDVQAADGWLVTANLWRDFFLTERLGMYGGGGLGGGGYRLSVTDGFVAGYDHVGGFAWQAGGGVFYRVNSRVTLDLGYRFFQNDRLTVGLQDLATGDSSGTYSSMISASELLLSVRIYEPFARWRR